MVDSTNVDSRGTIKIKLTPRAEESLRAIRRETGMTQTAFLERLVDWYLGLPPVVQMHVRDRNGDAAAALVQWKLAADAGAGPDATSIEQAAAIARAQVERLARLALAFRQEADDARGAKPVEKLTKPKGGKG